MDTITPYLCVADSRAAIEWYAVVLGARVTYDPIVMEDGRVGHVELTVGEDARFALADGFPESDVAPPSLDQGAAVSLMLDVPDCDAVAERARVKGARITRGPEDNPHTGRRADFRDPFGHRWLVSTRTEE